LAAFYGISSRRIGSNSLYVFIGFKGVAYKDHSLGMYSDTVTGISHCVLSNCGFVWGGSLLLKIIIATLVRRLGNKDIPDDGYQ
jgi:hypothetical protein